MCRHVRVVDAAGGKSRGLGEAGAKTVGVPGNQTERGAPQAHLLLPKLELAVQPTPKFMESRVGGWMTNWSHYHLADLLKHKSSAICYIDGAYSVLRSCSRNEFTFFRSCLSSVHPPSGIDDSSKTMERSGILTSTHHMNWANELIRSQSIASTSLSHPTLKGIVKKLRWDIPHTNSQMARVTWRVVTHDAEDASVPVAA